MLLPVIAELLAGVVKNEVGVIGVWEAPAQSLNGSIQFFWGHRLGQVEVCTGFVPLNFIRQSISDRHQDDSDARVQNAQFIRQPHTIFAG